MNDLIKMNNKENNNENQKSINGFTSNNYRDENKRIMINHNFLNNQYIEENKDFQIKIKDKVNDSNFNDINFNQVSNILDVLEPFNIELTRKNSNQIQSDLLEMGFDLNVINNLITYLEIKTTEQAIEYLSKTEGKWNHPLIILDYNKLIANANKEKITNDKNNLICLICGEIEEHHFINSIESIRNRKNKIIDNFILEKKNSRHLNYLNNHKIIKDQGNNYNNNEFQSSIIENDDENKIDEECKIKKINKYNLEIKSNNQNFLGYNINNNDFYEFDRENIILKKSEFTNKKVIFISELENEESKKKNNSSEIDNKLLNDIDIKIKDIELKVNEVKSRIIEVNLNLEEESALKDNKKNLVLDKLEKDSKNKKEKVLECEICMGEIKNKCKLDCKHIFCKECIEEYINKKINTPEINSIRCHHGKDKCAYVFSELKIKEIVKSNNMERYLKFLKRNKLYLIKGIILCPIPDCQSFSISDKNKVSLSFLEEMKKEYFLDELKIKIHENNYEKKISNLEFNTELIEKIKRNLTNNIGICIENNHTFCFECKNPPHFDKNCERGIEIIFNKFVADDKHHIKACPRCKFYIQKNKGCNHMKCANKECNYNFCWVCMKEYHENHVCMKEYHENHYSNIFSGRYRMQHTNQVSCLLKYPCLICPYKILMMIMYLLLICLALCLSPFIVGFTFCMVVYGSRGIKKYLKRENSLIAKISNFLFISNHIYLGLGLFPLFFYALAMSLILILIINIRI